MNLTHVPVSREPQAKDAADKAAGGGKDAALQGPANKLLQQVPTPWQLPHAALTLVQAGSTGGSRSQSAAPQTVSVCYLDISTARMC